MHYNLTNKKQRKQFWKDCEKAVAKCAGLDVEQYGWDNWKKMSPSEVLDFWDGNAGLWEHPSFAENLSKNVFDTFEYYDQAGVDELDDCEYD